VRAIIADPQPTQGPFMNRRIAGAPRRGATSVLSTVARGCIAALAAPAVFAHPPASGFAEPPVPAIGTQTVADAELLVPRPRTTPCTVSLFADQEFAGFTPVALSYAPPAGCPGPWAKVVLQADYQVTAGRQFDRTAVINLAGVNVYFGTTMEPGAATPRAWHIERDVTDASALLASPQAGEAILGNVVNGTYTGRIFGSASLVFYPVGHDDKPPQTPQSVIALAPSLTALSPGNPSLTKTLVLPRNVERLALDVIAQSQASDEFWYTCVPDADAGVLQSCGGGAFREVEVAIDGTPAGVAPVYPWIYTGGIDPRLWRPTPGVQTLNFEPSRIDLTPFAGQLDDGQPHTITLQVFGAQDNFSVTGTLLAWRDGGAAVLSGAVTQNTLAAPVVQVDDHGLVVDGANASGRVEVSSRRDFRIAGTLLTSHGPVTTIVDQKMTFANTQDFAITESAYSQKIGQRTDVHTAVTTLAPHGATVRTAHASYPLTVAFSQTLAGNAVVLDTTISQGRRVETHVEGPRGESWRTASDELVTPHATTSYDQTTGAATSIASSSQQRVRVEDTRLGCYDRTIVVTAGAVSAVKDRCDGPHR
jgi:hypothetical protein